MDITTIGSVVAAVVMALTIILPTICNIDARAENDAEENAVDVYENTMDSKTGEHKVL